MTFSQRIITRLLAIAAFAAVPAVGAQAASITVQASAKVTKPLELRVVQNLDFGQILLGTFTGTRAVSISQAGVLSCGAGLTCTGLTSRAIFNARGSNNQVIRVTAVASNLVNGTTGDTLTFTPSAPATVTLTSSGAPGNNFSVGGSITVSSTTPDGLYTGNMQVTIEYQ